jgi:hypothetical protein
MALDETQVMAPVPGRPAKRPSKINRRALALAGTLLVFVAVVGTAIWRYSGCSAHTSVPADVASRSAPGQTAAGDASTNGWPLTAKNEQEIKPLLAVQEASQRNLPVKVFHSIGNFFRKGLK